ncbi:hypothetical protein SNEBB_004076 [Seison nebaliae]|nr:hypothetical protein SNEBB_004076 [Seison nebaliae]
MPIPTIDNAAIPYRLQPPIEGKYFNKRFVNHPNERHEFPCPDQYKSQPDKRLKEMLKRQKLPGKDTITKPILPKCEAEERKKYCSNNGYGQRTAKETFFNKDPPVKKIYRIFLKYGSSMVEVYVGRDESLTGPCLKDLREKVDKTFGIPFADQRLYYLGQILQNYDDDRCLKDLYIWDGATINIGGCPKAGNSCVSECANKTYSCTI